MSTFDRHLGAHFAPHSHRPFLRYFNGEAGAGGTETDPKPEAKASETETDWKAKYEETLRHSRTWEDRAKANKDAADKLKQIEEAAKTELQKALDRAEAAEKAIKDRDDADAKAKQEADRKAELTAITDEVAKTTGVPAAALRGGNREEIEAHAESLKTLITHPLVIKDQDKTPDNEPSEKRAFARSLFGGED